MPETKPNLADLKKSAPENTGTAQAIQPGLSQEVKIAIFQTASQIYLINRPIVILGAPPKPPNDKNDPKAMLEYSKSLEAHMRSAMAYGATEAKSLWFNLYGEAFPSPVDAAIKEAK